MGSLVKSAIAGFNASRPGKPNFSVQSSFRKSPNLKMQLMFRSTVIRSVSKCGKNCMFCNYIFEGSKMTLKNGKTISTNGDFECSSRNVIYIAICGTCKESYIGETGDKLLTRCTVHRQQSKLLPSQAPVQADVHFRICGKDKYIVFPFYRPSKNDYNLRRRYEAHFIKIFKPKLNGQLYNYR